MPGIYHASYPQDDAVVVYTRRLIEQSRLLLAQGPPSTFLGVNRHDLPRQRLPRQPAFVDDAEPNPVKG